jgi:hypothetical protein
MTVRCHGVSGAESLPQSNAGSTMTLFGTPAALSDVSKERSASSCSGE